MNVVQLSEYLGKKSVSFFFFLAELYYGENTDIFNNFCVAWLNLPPPPYDKGKKVSDIVEHKSISIRLPWCLTWNLQCLAGTFSPRGLPMSMGLPHKNA